MADFMSKITGILGQYTNANPAQASADVHDHFDSVAQAVPQSTLAQGIAAAFNSNQTPAFGQMVGSLFSQSNDGQKAGMLSQLLSTAGPGLVSQVLGSAGLAGLASSGHVSPQAASQISPEAVQQLATEVHEQNPSVVDTLSSFYSEHPTLVKGLGAAALTIAMSHMSKQAA